MPTLDGLPSAAQIIAATDPLATLFKAVYPVLGAGPATGVINGVDVNGNTGTLAVIADASRTKTLGDGITYFGLGAPTWEAGIKSSYDSLVASLNTNVFFKGNQGTMNALYDQVVSKYLPAPWNFRSSTIGHKFDMWLSRLNALQPGTPNKPASVGVLAGTSVSNGMLTAVASGNAPRVVHTLVASTDWTESQASTEATQVALTGAQNAYTYTIAGTVPAGVFKVRLYRGYYFGATLLYYWDQDVPVTAGLAYPVITIQRADSLLNFFCRPPIYGQVLVTPEFATCFALPYSSTGPNGPQLSTLGMISPWNVALPPGNSYQGMGNPLGSSVFDTVTITGATTFSQVVGTPQQTNVAASNLQGYLGTAGLQARVTTLLNGTLATLTISYSYLDIATGATVQSAGVLVSGASSGTAVGSVAAFTVPANRFVVPGSFSVTAKTGTSTSGVVVIEALPIRSY